MFQTTIGKAVSAEGVALHSGAMTRLALHPAATDSGIVFRRTDLPGDNRVAADPRNVVDTRLGVRLRNAAGAEAMTVEHFLSAAALVGLDNAIIEIDAAELPIFDGSLKAFVALFAEAGLQQQKVERRAIAVSASIRVEDGDRSVEVLPAAGRRIEMTIDYPVAAIGRSTISIDLEDAGTRARIVSARTFCTLSDVEGMRARGFALGGSLDNAVVVDGELILNEGPLRDPEEFALHKAADLIGDLALLGAPVFGLVRAQKTGHDLNTRLARKIRESPDFGARFPGR
ncbi:MAG: UDP-3-O-acyl-N-acetylglucosamine deacetylase [Parvularculaceae bacterium]